MERTGSNSQSRLDRLTFQWLIREPLSFHLGKTFDRPLAIGHLAVVVAMIELREVEVEMLATDVMESSDDSPLEE